MIGTDNDIVELRLTVSEAVIASLMVSITHATLAGYDWKPQADAIMTRFSKTEVTNVTNTLMIKLAFLNRHLQKEYL